jgi:hypothetical protein
LLLFGRSDRSKELEILVLPHELAVLRRRSGRVGCIKSVPRRRGWFSSVESVARPVHLEELPFVLVALLPRAPALSAARGAAVPLR